jgi:hypothetical protein
MLDKLQVNKVVKNYLISIDNELKNKYLQMISTANIENKSIEESEVEAFVDTMISLLDYYSEGIYKRGISSITKDKSIFNNELLDEYKTKLEEFAINMKEAINGCYGEYDDDSLYDQIICIVISNCLNLFKQAQLETCIKLGIKEITLISSKESCQICRTKSKFKYTPEYLLKNIETFHPFCKLNICIDNYINFNVPNTNIKFINMPDKFLSRIKSIISLLRIYAKDIITDKTFIFEDKDEIVKEINFPDIDNVLKESNSSILFLDKTDDEKIISNSCGDELDYIIIRELIKEKINDDLEWWRDKFARKLSSKFIGDNCALFADPFINYIAEQDYESYFIESSIAYILDASLLKDIDLECYERLKTFVFKTEFKS